MRTLLLLAAISAPAFSTPFSTHYFDNWRVIQGDGQSVITADPSPFTDRIFALVCDGNNQCAISYIDDDIHCSEDKPKYATVLARAVPYNFSFNITLQCHNDKGWFDSNPTDIDRILHVFTISNPSYYSFTISYMDDPSIENTYSLSGAADAVNFVRGQQNNFMASH